MAHIVEKLALEWVELHGTQDQQQEYRAELRRRGQLMQDQEQRLNAMEGRLTSVEGKHETLSNTLARMSLEAHETRVEQNTMLKVLTTKVEAIATEQTREAGRREGFSESTAAERIKAEARARWFFPLIGLLAGLGIFVARSFVDDVVDARPPAQYEAPERLQAQP